MSDEEIVKAVSASMPFGKCVEPEDIADAAVFLASDEARMITADALWTAGAVLPAAEVGIPLTGIRCG